MQKFSKGYVIKVNNAIQKDYEYLLVEDQGNMPRKYFNPEFTPGDMLRLGVFDGKYMTDCASEYPAHMFFQARFDKRRPNSSLNAFKKHSGDSLAYWAKQNWIHPQDPRGWFEWYCRFWVGRRTEDDLRQIQRWLKFASRHNALLISNGEQDLEKYQAKRQSLLHWAHDPVPDFPFLVGETVADKTFRVLNKVRYIPEI